MRYRPLTRNTRNEANAAMEWVVEAIDEIRESRRIFAAGCNA